MVTETKGKTTGAGDVAAAGFRALSELANAGNDFLVAILAFRRSAGFAAACEAQPGLYARTLAVTDAVTGFAGFAANAGLAGVLGAEADRARAELAATG